MVRQCFVSKKGHSDLRRRDTESDRREIRPGGGGILRYFYLFRQYTVVVVVVVVVLVVVVVVVTKSSQLFTRGVFTSFRGSHLCLLLLVILI